MLGVGVKSKRANLVFNYESYGIKIVSYAINREADRNTEHRFLK